jgi:hypothetical protein
MAWLGHAIHVLQPAAGKDVDGRVKPGHDGGALSLRQLQRLLFRRSLARSGIRAALLGKLPVFGIARNAVEQAVALDAGRSLESFDYLPESILDSGELLRIFDIIRDERHYPLQVLDLNDNLSPFRHADAQSGEIGRSERGHRGIYRFFRISVGHRVEGIGPSRPPVMRISRRCRCECLKHFLQEEDKLLPEWFFGLIMTNRWGHAVYL